MKPLWNDRKIKLIYQTFFFRLKVFHEHPVMDDSGTYYFYRHVIKLSFSLHLCNTIFTRVYFQKKLITEKKNNISIINVNFDINRIIILKLVDLMTYNCLSVL